MYPCQYCSNTTIEKLNLPTANITTTHSDVIIIAKVNALETKLGDIACCVTTSGVVCINRPPNVAELSPPVLLHHQ